MVTDPPFNSKRMWNAPLGSESVGARFDDVWSMDAVKEDWVEMQEVADPALFHTVVGAGRSAGEPMQAYLSFMAVRLVEMHRVLKPTGSLYLHCDLHAGHYLKQLLDCVFGASNFRNEIVWAYAGAALTAAKKRFPRKHDTILFYTKSRDYYFDNPREDDISEQMTSRWGKYLESDGHTVLYGSIKHERSEEQRSRKRILKREGREPRDGDVAFVVKPSLLRSVWNIPEVRNNERYKESTGWPTQKPLVLYERIVKAGSPENGWVLDPFAGCATSLVAAERNHRRWAGIDLDEVATGITLKRLQQHADGSAFLDLSTQTVNLPNDPPNRTDDDTPKRSPNIKDKCWRMLGDGDRRPCPGCNRKKYYDDFHLDHIVPRSKDGENTDRNLQLLCGACNLRKGNRLSMKELRASWNQQA